MSIRIFIVDDQRLLRESFRKLIEMETDCEVIGSAGDGQEALNFLKQLEPERFPDVILMDIRMPRMDGITATQAIRELWPHAHIIILTTFDEDELIRSGLHAGALGYLLKDITAEQLSSTIQAAARGRLLLDPEIASRAFNPIPVPQPPLPLLNQNQLTEREREILTMLAHGATNREISEKLYITSGTVKNHLSNVFGKLGVRDRTQAALKAKELGISDS